MCVYMLILNPLLKATLFRFLLFLLVVIAIRLFLFLLVALLSLTNRLISIE